MVHVDIPEDARRPEVVREALAGRVDRLPPSLAVSLVLELDIPPSEQQEMLRGALRDADRDPHIRMLAAVSLAKLSPEDAVADVSALLAEGDVDERVAVSAVDIIGRAGGPAELERLDQAKKAATTELLRQRATFAQALIVHRHGLDREVELPAVETQPEPEAAASLPFVSRKAGKQRGDRAKRGVKEDFPDLDVDKHDVYELQCGPRLMAIVIQRAIVEGEGGGQPGDTPSIPAFVSFRNEESGDFFAALVALLGKSDKGGVSLVLTRLTGEPVFAGTGTAGPGQAEVALTAANTPGVPAISATVRIKGKQLEITGVSDTRSVPGLGPQRVDIP